MLLNAGAKVGARNRDGMTALELANHFNNAQTIPVLRRHAVSPLLGVNSPHRLAQLHQHNHFLWHIQNFLSESRFSHASRLPRDCDCGFCLQGLGKEENAVCAERIGVWGGKDVAQAPAGRKHNKHFGREEVSVQRVGVWHNSWAHYDTVVTPNDRRHKYGQGEKFNHGIH